MKYVLKQVVNLIAPYVVELFNRFLATGHFSAGFKEVVVLVLSRLDYSNGVLIGLPVYLVRRLQSVLNASARMIVILPFLRRSDHITDALVNLHWLRVPKRIQYKIAMLTYEVLKGIAPPYLGPLVRAADLQTTGSTWSPFSQHYSSGRTAKQIFYDWQSNLWGYCCSDIEQSTGGRDDITNSISTFRSRLKTYLFRLSYPDLVF